MGNKKITLYVDIISPFSWIGYWLTRHSPAFAAVETTYVPILLGGLMQMAGNSPPMTVKNKDKWIEVERRRWAKQFGIPIADTAPTPFPQSTVNAQRALCYVALKYPGELTAAIDALYEAFWVRRETVGKVEVIQAALEGPLGKEVTAEVLRGLKEEEAKKALKENTERSFAEGAFGLPWFVATNERGETEGFWGVDHVGQLLAFLGVETKGQDSYKALL